VTITQVLDFHKFNMYYYLLIKNSIRVSVSISVLPAA
jgi:hypothetical protein